MTTHSFRNSDSEYLEQLIRSSKMLSEVEMIQVTNPVNLKIHQCHLEQQIPEINQQIPEPKTPITVDSEKYFNQFTDDADVNKKTELINELYKNHLKNSVNFNHLIQKPVTQKSGSSYSEKLPTKTHQIINKTEIRLSIIKSLLSTNPQSIQVNEEDQAYLQYMVKDASDSLQQTETKEITFEEIKRAGSGLSCHGNSLNLEKLDSKQLKRLQRIEFLKTKFQKNKLETQKSQNALRAIETSESSEVEIDQPTFELLIDEDENGDLKLGIEHHDSITSYNLKLNNQDCKKSDVRESAFSIEFPFFDKKTLGENLNEFSTYDSQGSRFWIERPSLLNPEIEIQDSIKPRASDIIHSYVGTIHEGARNLKPVFSNPKFKHLANLKKQTNETDDREKKNSRSSTKRLSSKKFDNEFDGLVELPKIEVDKKNATAKSFRDVFPVYLEDSKSLSKSKLTAEQNENDANIDLFINNSLEMYQQALYAQEYEPIQETVRKQDSVHKKVRLTDKKDQASNEVSNVKYKTSNKPVKVSLATKEPLKRASDKIRDKFEELSLDERWRLEIEYKNKVMLSMNELLERQKYANILEITALLKEKMRRMVGADFLYYCSLLSQVDLRKIERVQQMCRARIMRKILQKIRVSNLAFSKLKRDMRERKTELMAKSSISFRNI